MRFKPVPEPPAELDAIETVRRALPAAAGDADDCCQQLIDETPLETRDEAATWLTFLRALELAVEEPAGYRRRGADSSAAGESSALERDRLRRAFRERVAGVETVLAALEDADRPLTAAAITDALRDDRSDGERQSRSPHFAADRVERLVEWAVLLGLAELTETERSESRYRPASERKAE